MAKVRRCSEAFTVQGAWWEPASPDQQASGAFTWDPSSGGELQLTGFFHDGSGSRSNWRGDVLYGVAEQAEFTLIDCREVGFTMQSPGVMRQRLHPFGGVLVGAMVPNVTQPVFDRLTLEVDHLAELSGRSLPDPELEWSDEVHVERITIEYERPRDVVAVLPHETVRLASESNAGGSVNLGRVEISETVVLSVETREPLPLEEIVSRYVSRLRDLVTFAAQQPTAIRSVRVAGPATTEVRGDGRLVKRSAQVLLPFLPTPQDRAQLKLLREQLIVLPSDDRAFRTLMSSWFQLAERLGPVLDLRFAPSYAEFMYSESRFLNAVQGVEALHRRELQGEPDQADLDARAGAIANCPPEHQEWLKGKLEYAHEPTLRRRLADVLDFVGPGLEPLIGNRKRFIARVVAVRNGLTHWDNKSGSSSGADLYRLAVALNFVIDAALLRLLGLEQDEITATLAGNSRFQFEAQQQSGS
jgi:antitoxin (DNA-binding transcriptional repressor) of toxin-antitoxin stability system